MFTGPSVRIADEKAADAVSEATTAGSTPAAGAAVVPKVPYAPCSQLVDAAVVLSNIVNRLVRTTGAHERIEAHSRSADGWKCVQDMGG